MYCVRFGHLASAWGTPMFYRRTVESILTCNSTADNTRNFSTQTHDISSSLTTWGEAHGGNCHSEVSSAPYGRTADGRNVLGPVRRHVSTMWQSALLLFQHTAVPKILQWFQLPLNHSRRDIRGAASSTEIFAKCFVVTALSSLTPLQTCQQDNVT
jgi:hypothetical protein